MKKETIIWTLQAKSWSFGFVIPDDRDYFWWDFFVNKKNFNWAKDWDKVEARELEKSNWKKPEAKILKILSWTWKKETKNKDKEVIKTVEWIYSWWDWNFWFVDVEWQPKWYFVYGHKKNWAKDWDKVKADIIVFKWKEEAIVTKILEKEEEILIWRYRDNDRFWFVIPEDKSWDIFIAWSRKADARNWDIVEVKIIKRWGKNPEGVITKVL